ncbi:hypothetical protein JOF43_004352 [Brachybacterium sacelli]|uniref:Uncharacterized protein n=1 Tax=Brachybacterium sacelli TaxID=173364 RepID=A0ABS4X7L9_9MICO|nr:hypothetical protein [Brachybacterium sacelli]MBP2384363.1 hypothetical protein [Brachybacterium sacelli]
MAFVIVADDGEVGVVVVTDVEGLAPDPFSVDERREPALLEPRPGDQRLGVVQVAVAVVSDGVRSC